jgi:hypothetical protein
MDREIVIRGKTWKQFERHVVRNAFGRDFGNETVRWNGMAPAARAKAFRDFYGEVPAPRDRAAVEQWLRARIPAGTSLDEAQAFLLLSGFDCYRSFRNAKKDPNVSFFAEATVDVEKNWWAVLNPMPFYCSVKLVVDEAERVTAVHVVRAEKIMVIPIH